MHWGLETLSSGSVPTNNGANSLTFRSGSLWRMSRLSELKAIGPSATASNSPIIRIKGAVRGGAPRTIAQGARKMKFPRYFASLMRVAVRYSSKHSSKATEQTVKSVQTSASLTLRDLFALVCDSQTRAHEPKL
jgi:hypothetical protein